MSPNLLEHPLYQEKLTIELQKESAEGFLECRDGEELVITQDGSITLYMALGKDEGAIKQASYMGVSSPGEKALLNAYCALIVGMTAQEVSDHAVIELEWMLRDHSKPRLQKGVTTPQNAHPQLEWLTRFSRKILKQVNQKTGNTATANFFARDSDLSWVQKTDAERIQAIEVALKKDRRFSLEGVRIVRVEDEVKVSLYFSPEWPQPKRQKFLFDAEFYLRTQLERNIQLFSTEKRDENTIRHKHQAGEKT